MEHLFRPLSMGALTSYAELADMAQSLAAARFSMLRGSFHRRLIKGQAYYYFGFRDVDGQGRSAYVGPESPALLQLIDEYRQSAPADRAKALAPRARACLALGCSQIRTLDLRAINRLAAYGFFAAGGALVGHQAFLAVGNMLGVSWNCRDQEVAAGVSLVVPADLQLASASAREALELGRLPIQEFSGLSADQTPINIFTPAAAETLLHGTVQGVVMSPAGACQVTLLEPARFAIHEVLASGEPPAGKLGAAEARLFRASALIYWHLDNGMADRLKTAWDQIPRRQPECRHAAMRGLEQLRKFDPSAAAGLID